MATKIVCMTTAELPVPGTRSSKQNCSECGTTVWLDEETKSDVEETGDSAVPICRKCFASEIANGDGGGDAG